MALIRAALSGAPLSGPHLVVAEAGAERAVALADGLTVGRGAEATLRLAGAGVSRLHARLRLRGDGAAAVEDLGSKNGLRLNGRPLAAGLAPLAPGDVLEVGSARLRLVEANADAGAEAVPAALGMVPAASNSDSGPTEPPLGAAQSPLVGRSSRAAPSTLASLGPPAAASTARALAFAAAGLLLLALAAALADAALRGG